MISKSEKSLQLRLILPNLQKSIDELFRSWKIEVRGFMRPEMLPRFLECVTEPFLSWPSLDAR